MGKGVIKQRIYEHRPRCHNTDVECERITLQWTPIDAKLMRPRVEVSIALAVHETKAARVQFERERRSGTRLERDALKVDQATVRQPGRLLRWAAQPPRDAR